ncbi:MAG: redoxin domain-containing protein [Candidatus Zixiibacteriota bacterium]|nr:MAG: redoxin domain-containing protein [candidate division Zixibacteria bacterium]
MEAHRSRFEAAKTQVLAINPAAVASHQNYASKQGFNFPILSDPGEKILAAYKSQKPTGKGVLRTVYALDPDGKVIFAERGHAAYDEILARITSHK